MGQERGQGGVVSRPEESGAPHDGRAIRTTGGTEPRLSNDIDRAERRAIYIRWGLRAHRAGDPRATHAQGADALNDSGQFERWVQQEQTRVREAYTTGG